MPTTLRLRPAVVAARERLAEGREKLQQQHDSGSPGVQVCARLTDVLDGVLLDLYAAALADLAGGSPEQVESEIALVAHGGYGRRDVAPFSDVDLMLLHKSRAEPRITPLARRLTQDVFDAGLQLGFSVRTPSQACRLAMRDATIFTSLAESRFLGGSVSLFTNFFTRFRRTAGRRSRALIDAIDLARREERAKYGDTVYLLRPNVKRSRGALRDIQLLRWVGFARYGEVDPETLYRKGILSHDDHVTLRNAREFLLRLRNEIHFHAGKPQDVLEKSEQLRLAEILGYDGNEGLLPVERFMREYFEHTSAVRYTVAQFVADARPRAALTRFLAPLFSHAVDGDFRVGPWQIGATSRGLKRVAGDLAEVLRLMELANLCDKRIDHPTWQAIRSSMTNLAEIKLSPEACERFLSLMSRPTKLGEMLRRLHQLRVLERIVAGLSHARCLLQFNEYHKYTVDEHSLRAVEHATDFLDDPGPVGDAYRSIRQKRTLHLALLLHDLGKGFVEDHSVVGARLAAETAQRLNLPERETETLVFLVRHHLAMSHLAFRRDMEDESVVLQFAVEIGSAELLQMLFVLTCADLAAVGPGVLNQWKLNLLTELYDRTRTHLAGDGPSRGSSERVQKLREQVRALAADKPSADWWDEQTQALPSGYLLETPPQQIVEVLETLRQLPHDEARAWGRYVPERNAVEYTIGTYEEITPGVFHKLTGALTSRRQQILSAEINTLARALVLDRFFVSDMDFGGRPPAERIDEVAAALIAALKDKSGKPPTFARVWNAGTADGQTPLSPLPTRIEIDNNTSEAFTIIDVFTHDRIGLLYTISRTLFELGLSVGVAKIGTYLDQVVDVFYVTGPGGRKVEDDTLIREVRRRLLEAIGQPRAFE